MLVPAIPTARRTARAIHRGPRARRRPAARPLLEPLEARVVLTIIFYGYGAEPVTDGGGWNIPNVTVKPIFWGNSFEPSPGQFSPDYNNDLGLLDDLSYSPYFNGLAQYLGGPPQVRIAAPVVDPSATAPTGPLAGQSATTSAVFGEVDKLIDNGTLLPPSAYTGTQVVYLVITPPGAIENDGSGRWGTGWNQPDSFTDTYASPPTALTAPVIWSIDPWANDSIYLSGTTSDQLSVNVGHELAEMMTDPAGDSTGASYTTPGPNNTLDEWQICDGEARFLNYRLGGPNGFLVQSYWSTTDDTFIIPDGNTSAFYVSNGTQTQFTEGSNETLTIDGGVNGYNNPDTITLNSTSAGAISATLDGQAVQFDAGAIGKVVVDVAATTTVNIAGIWLGGTSVTLNDVNERGLTINVSPDADLAANNFSGANISVIDPDRASTLNVDDQGEPGWTAWTLGATTIAANNHTMVSYTGEPTMVNLYTGTGGASVDVEAVYYTTGITMAGSGNTVAFAQNGQNLDEIAWNVVITGLVSLISLDDQADPNPETAIFDAGQFYELGYEGLPTMGKVLFSGSIGELDYYGGTGNDTFQVAPTSQNLDVLAPRIAITGGSGFNSLTVDDALHAATPSEASNQYVLGTALWTGTVARDFTAIPGGSTSRTVSYTNMPGGVTLDTDNIGTPVDIESTLSTSPVFVDLGTGNTPVTIAAQGQSLAGLASAPSIVANPSGTATLTVDDQRDPYGSGTSYLVTSGMIERTLPVSPSAAIAYVQGTLGGLTLNTDNNGTPVDIESVPGPTTVDLGTGNTAVTIEGRNRNLAMLAAGVSIVGGGGSDSLTVDDAADPLASSVSGSGINASGTTYSYMVTGNSIARSTYSFSRYFHWSSSLTVGYSGITAGVALDTDNNGTPVDVEGTSAPTTIVTGTGNTAVTVTQTNQNLGLLGADLTVAGGGGLDSLAIYDTPDPYAASATRTSTTTYHYTVTGQSIARTRTARVGYSVISTTRTIAHSGMPGGVELATDDNSTPAYVTGAPGPYAVSLVGGTGVNTLYGPAVGTSWGVTGANAGSLGGWVRFSAFASLYGGGGANSFDFSAGGSLSGTINGGSSTGPNILNYARESSAVAANLSTGVVSQVAGTVGNIQGVVGSTGPATLVGAGRCVLIGGGGPDQITGGSSDSLLIGGGTTWDTNDAAIESIVAEWDQTSLTFAQRVAALTNAGPNDPYVLNASTITEDSAASTITCGSGQTWVIAHYRDTVLGLVPNVDQVNYYS